MNQTHSLIKWLLLLFISLFITNCGGGSSSTTSSSTQTTVNDDFNQEEYKGLVFYPKSLPVSDYSLNQLSNAEFNALTETQQHQVADKLLSTLFFGYPLKELQLKIDSGNFINDIISQLSEEKTDRAWLENHILDEEKFRQSDNNEQEAVDILARFYAMQDLDSYFFKNWISYILTQTIMFSPAYELESTHTPNIARVYNRIVMMLDVESGMRYITYVHMASEDNWRRFRSPEDNGREMLEIFALDMDDSHVPIAGKALQNWKLDRDSDTLVVSLNQNTQPLSLFGTTIYNGDDFYRELAKSDLFTKGVTKRLVDFFFPNATLSKKSQITTSIVSSRPETWQDILLQIVLSEEYLLDQSRAKSAEELFFSFAKKAEFQHRTNTFHELKDALEEMHQASMKYKLGKLKRVPLDTLSFANYHKYIREQVLLRKSNPVKIDDYGAWDRQGWSENFVANENFNLDESDEEGSLISFIQYLFNTTIKRDATQSELTLFKEHMLRDQSDTNDTQILDYTFDMLTTNSDPEKQLKYRESNKNNIAVIVLDYISRLTETYTQREVN
jgi:hypothetical protein